MDNIVCCLKFIDGKLYRINLSAVELNELDDPNSPNEPQIKQTYKDFTASTVEKLTALIWLTNQDNRTHIEKDSFRCFMLGILKCARHSRYKPHILIFKKNNGRYISFKNDDSLIDALREFHSDDLREWSQQAAECDMYD